MVTGKYLTYRFIGYTAEILGIAAVVSAWSDKINGPSAVAVGFGGAVWYILGKSINESAQREQRKDELVELLKKK